MRIETYSHETVFELPLVGTVYEWPAGNWEIGFLSANHVTTISHVVHNELTELGSPTAYIRCLKPHFSATPFVQMTIQFGDAFLGEDIVSGVAGIALLSIALIFDTATLPLRLFVYSVASLAGMLNTTYEYSVDELKFREQVVKDDSEEAEYRSADNPNIIYREHGRWKDMLERVDTSADI